MRSISGTPPLATALLVLSTTPQELSACLPQDGRIAVVVLFDSTVTVWDLERQEPLTVLQRWGQRDGALGHTGGVNAAYVSQDGCKVLTVSKDCTARIWDVSLGTSTHVLEGAKGLPRACSRIPPSCDRGFFQCLAGAGGCNCGVSL